MCSSPSPHRSFIPAWQLIGPFDNPRDERLNRLGIDVPYPPEREIDLAKTYTGVNGQPVRWTLTQTPPRGRMDLYHFDPYEMVVVYALTYIYSPKDRTVPLLLGTDDGVKVFVNGEPVHRVLAIRVVRPDNDRVPVALKKGWNTLMLKIENNYGGYNFYARVLDPEHTLRFSPTRPNEKERSVMHPWKTAGLLLALLSLCPLQGRCRITDEYLRLQAGAKDPLFTTYAAPMARSRFFADKAYFMDYFTPDKPITYSSQFAGDLAVLWKFNNVVIAKTREFARAPVVVASFPDMAVLEYEPFAGVKVQETFCVYSSGSAVIELHMANTGTRSVERDGLSRAASPERFPPRRAVRGRGRGIHLRAP